MATYRELAGNLEQFTSNIPGTDKNYGTSISSTDAIDFVKDLVFSYGNSPTLPSKLTELGQSILRPWAHLLRCFIEELNKGMPHEQAPISLLLGEARAGVSISMTSSATYGPKVPTYMEIKKQIPATGQPRLADKLIGYKSPSKGQPSFTIEGYLRDNPNMQAGWRIALGVDAALAKMQWVVRANPTGVLPLYSLDDSFDDGSLTIWKEPHNPKFGYSLFVN